MMIVMVVMMLLCEDGDNGVHCIVGDDDADGHAMKEVMRWW